MNIVQDPRKVRSEKIVLSFLFFAAASLLLPLASFAQTDIHISGPQGGFPVAIPKLCTEGVPGGSGSSISERVTKNLDLSGLFKVLNPRSFVESASKCANPKEIAYSDWSLIGAEGVVKGIVRASGDNTVSIDMLLFDVQQQKPVIGKRYQASPGEVKRVADRFSNVIMKYFTGEAGIFGSQLAYVSRVGRFKELFVMDLDGSNNRKITNDRGLAMTPSWSPNGQELVYTSYRTKSPELFTIPSAGGSPRQVTRLDGLEIGPEFSSSGREILTSSSMFGVPNIILLDLKGKLLKKITSSGAIDVSPSWSPDNSKVTFCSNRGGGPQIYITTAGAGDRGGARRLSFTGSNYCTSPSWSPKGDKIAYVCRNRGNQIYVSNVDGSEPVQLTYTGNNEDPSWSPDGRYIVYSSNFGRGGPRNLAILPLASGKTTQVGFSKVEESQPAWSPLLDDN